MVTRSENKKAIPFLSVASSSVCFADKNRLTFQKTKKMKRLTVKEKKIRGTYRPSEIHQPVTHEPLTKIPEPMMNLSPDGMRYFTNCCETMLSGRTLTAAEIPAICRAAKLYESYLKAVEAVEIHGTWQTTATGFTTRTGCFQVMCDCEKGLASFERNLGLTTVSRSKLPPAPEPKKKNPFDEGLLT